MRAELRTSPARWPLLALALIGIAELITGRSQWVGWWQDTALHVHTFSGIVVGIPAAALAAWTVGRSRASGVNQVEGVGRQPGPAVVARSVVAIWVLATGVFFVVLVAALARTAVVSWGVPPWGLVLMTVCLLAAQVGFGAMLGAWLPRWLAPLVAIVVLYGGAFAPIVVPDGEHTWGRLYPIIQQFWDRSGVEAFDRLAIAAAWLLAAAALCLTVAGARQPWQSVPRRSLAAVTVVAAAAAAGVLVPQVAPGAQFANARGVDDPITCAGPAEARVCVFEEQEQLLAPMADAFAQLHRAGAGLDYLPARLVQAGSQPAVDRAEGAEARTAFWTPTTADPTTAELLDTALAVSTPTLPDTCYNANGENLVNSEPLSAVRDLLAARLGLPANDPDTLAPLLRVSSQQQDGWLNAAAAAAAACQRLPPLPRP